MNKPDFRQFKGFVASRRNRQTGDYNLLFDAKEQGFDDAGGKWVTTCEKHKTLCNHTSKKKALRFLPHAMNWCEECQDIVYGQRGTPSSSYGQQGLDRMKKGEWAQKMKKPYQMTQEEIGNWEFGVPQGGGSKTPKTVLGWESDEYETLADLASGSDTWRFKEALGVGWERNGVPRTTYLIPKIQKGEKIKIYRASDTGDIVPGAYVTESKQYAQEHGERHIPNRKWKIYEMEVYPDELVTYGDPHEFLYRPRTVKDYQRLEVDKARASGKKVPKRVMREYRMGSRGKTSVGRVR